MAKYKAKVKVKSEIVLFLLFILLIFIVTRTSGFTSCNYDSRYTTFPSGNLPMMNSVINQDYIPEYPEYPEYYSGYSDFP